MAVTFDSTIGGAAATSFCSVAQAAQYFEDTSSAKYANWVVLSDDQQKQALNKATQYLSAKYVWSQGEVVTETQALAWPRYSVYNKNGQFIDSTEIPVEIIYATCEVAYLAYDFSGATPVEQALLAETGRTTKREQLDGVGEIEYFKGAGNLDRYFPEIDMLLAPYISGSSTSNVVVNIRRA